MRIADILNSLFRALRFRSSGLRSTHARGIVPTLPILITALAILSASVVPQTSVAQIALQPGKPLQALPQDQGNAGLKQMLLRMQTTARLLQTTAHPDDEDGGMLTLESRGRGATVELLTLNRGEGGQNKVGSNLFDMLGVLRTLELLASDQHYGVEQRFSRVADFGFSKNPEETFQKWQGHDLALGDMVRVIRTFRPDVIVSRFQGGPPDGHGNHQASGILSREAFHAAADPTRFPEQIKEGLLPWQAKKLYVGNVCGFGAQTCADEKYTVKLNTGEVDPALGMSYAQFAMEGLKHQLSQGAGSWTVDEGDRYTFYKLAESVLPSSTPPEGHEKDFFDGIDTTLPGLASRLGADESRVPFLRTALEEITAQIKDAARQSDKDSGSASPPLFSALGKLDSVIARLADSGLASSEKSELTSLLNDKRKQAEGALNLALNVSIEASVAPLNDVSNSNYENSLTAVSPGEKFAVRVKLHNGSQYPLRLQELSIAGTNAQSGSEIVTGTIEAGKIFSRTLLVEVPNDAEISRPYWHRDNPVEDSVNALNEPKHVTFPFPPMQIYASAKYTMALGTVASAKGKTLSISPVRSLATQVNISAPVISYGADAHVPDARNHPGPVAVVPAFSVIVEPVEQIIPVDGPQVRSVAVAVRSNSSELNRGTLNLQLPSGWRVEPATLPVEFRRRGEEQKFKFNIYPGNLREGKADIHAILTAGANKYSEGYSLVTREDLGSFYYFQPAVQRISIVDVRVPKDLKIAYIMGAGDDIPAVLQQIGMNATVIAADKLPDENLNQYGTIVLGIRAYDTQKNLVANNKSLLDYVFKGGTLVTQYNASVSEFNSARLTPYPTELSRERISVEEAPVEILAPQESVFHFPNEITQRDFEHWVQERGLYFMDRWDTNFTPLLSSNDMGEPARKGGLLLAHYGKGTYIYTGYAFFRQLPAGVPGAIRLYVNLLSAGHQQ
ncbi:MAG: PIG-L family deacetylase [Acidobacteriota bacterium]|nr:PIG-L family deacetylase [Acidobacteriota bacterium]